MIGYCGTDLKNFSMSRACYSARLLANESPSPGPWRSPYIVIAESSWRSVFQNHSGKSVQPFWIFGAMQLAIAGVEERVAEERPA